MDEHYNEDPGATDSRSYAHYHPDCAEVHIFMAATQLMIACGNCRVVQHLEPIAHKVNRYEACASRAAINDARKTVSEVTDTNQTEIV